jgi:hypothetical protein
MIKRMAFSFEVFGLSEECFGKVHRIGLIDTVLSTLLDQRLSKCERPLRRIAIGFISNGDATPSYLGNLPVCLNSDL